MNPEISVIIPSYNAARYVAEAVESSLDQTLPPLEVIVVDDGSTDETGEILRRYGDRIRLVRQPNGGLPNARNRGIRESRGDLIALLDADDVWVPDKLEKQWRRLRDHPDAGLVHSDFLYWFTEGDEKVPSNGLNRERSGQCLGKMFLGNGVNSSTALIRRACLDRVGLFDESLRACEDYDFFLRFARHYEFAYVDEQLALYRQHASNMSADPLLMLTHELRVLRKGLQADPELRRLVGKRIIDARIGDLLFNLGYHLHDAHRRAEARACLRQSLSLRPWRVHALFLYAMNLLPDPWVRTMRRLKAKLS